jgi:hypothetical protein
MKKIFYLLMLTMSITALTPLFLKAQKLSSAKKILQQDYNLVPPQSADTQYYDMESVLQQHAPDGTINVTDIYHLYLRCVPSGNSSKGDEYTCMKFTVQLNQSKEVLIPSLTGWKYYFKLTATGRNEKGEVFGIDHSKFDQLKDENGKMIPLGNTYHVYNAFIDFHSMSVFADKAAKDSGAQALTHIGDKIVHSASYSQPPVNLGSGVAEGSYFKNGLITLYFKGLGLVNDKTCAILEYDSGLSSFYMLIKPMPAMEVPTKGSSHYFGDIFKDLSSGWIQKAVLHEIVVSETTVPGMTAKINTVTERSIRIKNVKRFP